MELTQLAQQDQQPNQNQNNSQGRNPVRKEEQDQDDSGHHQEPRGVALTTSSKYQRV